jgi:hypothetical protein
MEEKIQINEKNQYGLSRKSNIAMTAAGCFTAVGVATRSDYVQFFAIGCALIVALVTIIIQASLERNSKE